MKKYVKLFEEYSEVFENRNEYPYGCSMVFLRYPELFKIQDSIDPEDLHKNGFEEEPHVTLLYGIHDGGDHDELDDEKLQEIIEISKPVLDEAVILKGVSAFENEDYDVLKFDAESASLRDANKKLSDFPNSNSFPDYKPHATIAYLKPGKAKDYIEKFKDLKDIEVQPEKIVYSRPNGTRMEEYPIKESVDELMEKLENASQELEKIYEQGANIAEVVTSAKKVITNAQNVKSRTAKSVRKISVKMKDSADTAKRMKDKSTKTTDPMQAKVYDARTKEEASVQRMLDAKRSYEESKAAVADAKIEVAQARLQKASKNK